MIEELSKLLVTGKVALAEACSLEDEDNTGYISFELFFECCTGLDIQMHPAVEDFCKAWFLVDGGEFRLNYRDLIACLKDIP